MKVKRLLAHKTDPVLLWEFERDGKTRYMLYQGFQSIQLKSEEAYEEITNPAVIKALANAHNETLKHVLDNKFRDEFVYQHITDALILIEDGDDLYGI